ncbi:prolipoprotein diacylglyceryl transferase [Candidatus Woesearchaeota archaeon]|nr:MAG: prolipoprotein diacylglyceryl transferase [Candidatus Woesearchaeota archaeon]
MYIHNLNPVALDLGFAQIYWYGIVYVVGYLLTYWVLFKRRAELGLSRKQVDDLVFSFLVGMLIGARIFHFLFNNPAVFIKDPLELLRIWHGGMSFFGALTGISIAAAIMLKRWKLSFYKIADIVVLPVTATLVLGRLANFVNGELWGRVTDVSWCVVFPSVSGCRHPYQLYAAGSHLLLLGILWYGHKHQKNLREGTLWFTFLIGYASLRFITDFFREDPMFLFLTNWQWLSLVAVVVALLWKSHHDSQRFNRPAKHSHS